MIKPALLLVFFLSPLGATGAIIYRSLTPGEVFRNEGAVLFNDVDLNADGMVDFFTTTAGGKASLVPMGNNRILSLEASLPDLGRSIVPLLGGESIMLNLDDPFSWTGYADRINEFDDGGSFIYKCDGRVQPGSPPDCDSTLPAQELRYVGLELEVDGESFYGWVALSSQLTVVHTMQVHAWAYENEPGQSIVAGSVPEPRSWTLLAVSLGSMVARRRRRHAG